MTEILRFYTYVMNKEQHQLVQQMNTKTVQYQYKFV